MFFDYLMNEANKGNTNLFFDNSVLDSKYNKSGITALKNGEFIEGDFSGFFLPDNHLENNTSLITASNSFLLPYFLYCSSVTSSSKTLEYTNGL